MNFDRKFFEDEVREGFFVSSTMKHSWAAQLEVLDEIASVCIKHSIEWFLDFGSLLGAVRHGGFIPWDDDMDISMTRPNYEKFLEVAKNELPPYYSVLNSRFNSEYEETITRVSCGNGIHFSPERIKKYHGTPLSPGIDIFVMDYVPRNAEQAAIQEEIGSRAANLYDRLRVNNSIDSETQKLLSELQSISGVTFDEGRPLMQQIRILQDNVYRLFSDSDGDYLAHMEKLFSYKKSRYKLHKSLFENIIWVPFEHFELPVPVGYDQVLNQIYPNYMKLVKGKSAHNYPLYGMQEEFMFTRFPEKKFDYRFSARDLTRPKFNKKKENDKILMIISHADHWYMLASIYKQLTASEKDITLLIIPYFDKDINNNINEKHFEASLLPEGLAYVSCDEFTFKGKEYSRIFTVDGIDECGRDYTVDKEFYTSELGKHSPQVIYVSPYKVNDFTASDLPAYYNLRFYAGIPGVVRSDYTIVPSGIIKERFIEYLTSISGVNYRYAWKKKIITIDSLEL